MSALHELSLVELTRALRTRQVSAREAVEDHLARIQTVNPRINAVVTVVAEQALEQAAAADQRAAAGEELPVLHGVPMTHKDTLATAGIRTTQGSPLMRETIPTDNDLIIERLQAAGVVSTGKNNVPEFAAGSHTFNPVFGTTGNPYDPSRSAGGSSGGAAAALAARIQALADGTDMGGSLRNPAAWCNVVGLRPSNGVVPNVPAANPHAWLSRTGLMARSVDDLALAMSVVAGSHVAAGVPAPVQGSDFAALLTDAGPADLRGVRIGVALGLGLDAPVDPAVRDLVQAQADVFAQLGATVEEACPDLTDADRVFDVTRAFDMATNLRDLVAQHGDGGDIKPDVVWNVRRGLELTASDLMDAAVARGRLDAAVRSWFTGWDLLLTPTSAIPPFDADDPWPRQIDGVPMRTYVEWMRTCSLISATGCPALSMPAGFVGDLPIGLQLVAPHGHDPRLLAIARVYERVTGYARLAPSEPASS